jgi:L-alanine-DL-glutamate epimerase-like enolase superfamily enzyme
MYLFGLPRAAQVGRRGDPQQDAAAVLAVRQAVGPGVGLRADANCCWTLEQAVQVRAGG